MYGFVVDRDIVYCDSIDVWFELSVYSDADVRRQFVEFGGVCGECGNIDACEC